MKHGTKGVIIGLFLSIVTISYGFATLSFDTFNSNMFIAMFLFAFAYLIYAIIFFSVIYHQKIFDNTIKKAEKRVEHTVGCFSSRKCVLKLMDLSALITFLSLAIIATSAPQTFISVLPGDEFLKPVFSYFFENFEEQNISIPNISSLKFIMLAFIGPSVVFVLRLAHVLKLEEEKEIKKHKKNDSEKLIKNKFPGVRAVTVFLFVSPVILIISRIFTSQPIEFDFTLVAMMMSAALAWMITWFMQAFESVIFANTLSK